MAAISVGEIWSALRIDGAQAKKDAAKAGGDAGAEAGRSMGASLKRGMVVVGSAVSAALSVALVGRFAALERAQANFRKETGATAKEAERAGKAINAMAGRNLQSVEEIGETLTKVHTDLGLTGDEAERVTEQFLKFGQATGQNAAEAVLAFDDVLDAWGLTAEDAAGIMDQLVASHQRYGGSIEDNQRNLAALAPALKAMNVSQDEAVGLLNLFAASGLDASKAQLAFNSAVAKLPPGTNLMDFLETIQSIEDPSERARAAIEVFGSRAGAGLANALEPGKGSLEDFVITAEEVPGAMEEAAEASYTFMDRIRNAMGGVVSNLVEMLGPAGPLLTAVGSMGQLLAPALSKAWGSLRNSRALAVAIAAAGAASSAIYSAAESVASAFFAGIRGLWGRLLAAPGVKAAIAAAGVASGAVFAGGEAAGGFLGSFASKFKIGLPLVARSAVAALGVLSIPVALNFILKDRDAKSKDDYTGELGLPRLGQTDYEFDEAFKVRVEHWRRLAGADTEGWRLWQQSMFAAAGGGPGGSVIDWAALGDTLTQGSQQMEGAFRQSGERSGAAVAQGVTDRTEEIRGAWFLVARESAAVMAESRREIVNGMRLAVVDMKEKIRTGKTAIIEQFRDLAWQSKHPFAEKNYAQWLREKHAEAMTEAEKKARNGRPGVAAQYRQLAADILKEYLTLPSVAVQITKDFLAALAPIRQHLTQGPLALIPLLPGNLQIPGRAMGGPVTAGHPYIVGEHRPELFVPRQDGYILPSVESGAAGGVMRHLVELSEDTIRRMHAIGMDDRAVGEAIGEILSRAADTAHIGYRSPRGAL